MCEERQRRSVGSRTHTLSNFLCVDAHHIAHATMLFLPCMVLANARSRKREAERLWPTKEDFLTQLHHLNSSAWVLDVGANDGWWTRNMLGRTSAFPGVRFLLVEPQPRFQSSLSQLAASHAGSQFISAAAWVSNGQHLNLSITEDDRAASVVPAQQGLYPGMARKAPRLIRVPTFDLADWILRTIPVAPGHLAYLHLDIESAEFRLIPRLVFSGALCRLSHVHIEWHLKPLAAASDRELSDSLAMRVGFEHMLEQACSQGYTEGAVARTDGQRHQALWQSSTTTIMVDHELASSRTLGRELLLRVASHVFPEVNESHREPRRGLI